MMPWAVNHKAKHAAYMRGWRKTHPLSEEARPNNRIRAIARYFWEGCDKLPCMVCGSMESQMHRLDPDRSLDVIWLCRKHHRELLREQRRLAMHAILRHVKAGETVKPEGAPER